jgi:hypothetical protein
MRRQLVKRFGAAGNRTSRANYQYLFIVVHLKVFESQ